MIIDRSVVFNTRVLVLNFDGIGVCVTIFHNRGKITVTDETSMEEYLGNGESQLIFESYKLKDHILNTDFKDKQQLEALELLIDRYTGGIIEAINTLPYTNIKKAN